MSAELGNNSKEGNSRLVSEMNVLKGCDFLAGDGGLDAVRVQYMEEVSQRD